MRSLLLGQQAAARRWTYSPFIVRCCVLSLVALCSFSASTQAQTWTLSRGYPALWQIAAVDGSGETGFPYGEEDVAGDGLRVFSAAEAAADLRTVYATADRNQLWVRAYVSAQEPPPLGVQLLLFLDVDENSRTGGPAERIADFFELPPDPSQGGYDLAVVTEAGAAPTQVLLWSAEEGLWVPLEAPELDVLGVERGLAVDPLRIGPAERGYLQVVVGHGLSNLNELCASRMFVRLVHAEQTGPDEVALLVDDPLLGFECQSRVPDYSSVPVVLRSFTCGSAADCPGDSPCEQGVCLVELDCAVDLECPLAHECADGRCVRVGEAACVDDRDCGGLLCVEGACQRCDSAAELRCDEERLCAPEGTCISAAEVAQDRERVLSPLDEGPKARGGALLCAASPGQQGHSGQVLLLWTAGMLGLVWRYRRRTRWQRRVVEGGRPWG